MHSYVPRETWFTGTFAAPGSSMTPTGEVKKGHLRNLHASSQIISSVLILHLDLIHSFSAILIII